MTGFDPELLTAQVLATFEGTPGARLRTLTTALVRHLHAFAREVELTSAERTRAIAFLTAIGQISTDVRQEGELLSDVLGLSSLVESSSTPAGGTTQTLTVGGNGSMTVSWPAAADGYYDVTITANTSDGFTRRYAGRIA